MQKTIDHIYVLKHFIDIFIMKKKRLFCTFIDYSKAFDLFGGMPFGLNYRMPESQADSIMLSYACINKSNPVSL